MTSFAQEFRIFIENSAPDKAKDNSNASGSSKVHHGLSNPTMRDFVKSFASEHPDLSYDDWRDTLSDLYQGVSIDEACFAGFMLGHYQKYRQQLPLSMLDEWLSHLEGWREIDTTCQSNYTAKELLANWDEWEPFLHDLARRETIQHRRASLVLLVKPVRDSADERLIKVALHNVDLLKHEMDKLITKAVSWVLRASIKRHREMVRSYVTENTDSLPAIAVREFEKKYSTGKK
ncbi:MAG: DNA alkylation repair protein [Chloroflexota bacterium]